MTTSNKQHRRSQILQFAKGNVCKTKDELGNVVWATFDARNGDEFYSETYHEAVEVFVRNWDNLNQDEQELCINLSSITK